MSFDKINRFCNKSKYCFATGSVSNPDTEITKQYNEDKYYGDSRSIEHFIKSKLKMLRNDMMIEPTAEELEKLYSLKTMIAVDNTVHSIIDRHWSSF